MKKNGSRRLISLLCIPLVSRAPQDPVSLSILQQKLGKEEEEVQHVEQHSINSTPRVESTPRLVLFSTISKVRCAFQRVGLQIEFSTCCKPAATPLRHGQRITLEGSGAQQMQQKVELVDKTGRTLSDAARRRRRSLTVFVYSVPRCVL